MVLFRPTTPHSQIYRSEEFGDVISDGTIDINSILSIADLYEQELQSSSKAFLTIADSFVFTIH